MNHSATQLRLVRNRIQSDGASTPPAGTGIDVWTVLIPLLTPNSGNDARWYFQHRASSRFRNKTSRRGKPRRRSRLAEDALGGTFRRRHRRLHVLAPGAVAVSYTHLRAHETRHDLVCRLLLEKKK